MDEQSNRSCSFFCEVKDFLIFTFNYLFWENENENER